MPNPNTHDCGGGGRHMLLCRDGAARSGPWQPGGGVGTMAASHQLEGGMRATACVLAPRQQQQQQANKLEASKIKITKTQEKQLWCEDAGLRSQVFLQEMQQSHLIMLSRLTAANAVSLVWVDLQKRQGCGQASWEPHRTPGTRCTNGLPHMAEALETWVTVSPGLG